MTIRTVLRYRRTCRLRPHMWAGSSPPLSNPTQTRNSRVFCLRSSAPTGTRTLTWTILSRLPLPIGLWGRLGYGGDWAMGAIQLGGRFVPVCQPIRVLIHPTGALLFPSERNVPRRTGTITSRGSGRTGQGSRVTRPWDATRQSRRPREVSPELRGRRCHDARRS